VDISLINSVGSYGLTLAKATLGVVRYVVRMYADRREGRGLRVPGIIEEEEGMINPPYLLECLWLAHQVLPCFSDLPPQLLYLGPITTIPCIQIHYHYLLQGCIQCLVYPPSPQSKLLVNKLHCLLKWRVLKKVDDDDDDDDDDDWMIT